MADAALRRPRLHAARDRHGRHRHALVGDARRGRRAARRAGGARRPRAQRAGARRSRSSARRRASASPSRCRASSGTTCGAATRSSRPAAFPVELPARRRAGRARADRRRRARSTSTTARRTPSRASCAPASATRSFGSPRRSSPRAATASCCARTRPSAAASCSTRRRRARLDVARLELLERGDPAAIVARDRARAGDGPGAAGARPAAAGASSRSGSRRSAAAGDWYFSEEWLEELRRACASGCASAPRASRSIPGCRSASCCSTGRGRTRSRRCSSSSAAAARLYLPGSAPSLGDREEEARRLEAELAAGRLRARLDDRELGAVPRAAPAVSYRVGDGFAVSRDAVRARHRRRSETLDADHARRLPRRARHLAPRRAAPARALRRRRAHAPRRRRACVKKGGETMNERELIERYNDAWNAHDLDAIASMHADDIVFHNYSAGERAEGADAVREHIAQIFRNNPDISFRGRRLYARRRARRERVDGDRDARRQDSSSGTASTSSRSRTGRSSARTSTRASASRASSRVCSVDRRNAGVSARRAASSGRRRRTAAAPRRDARDRGRRRGSPPRPTAARRGTRRPGATIAEPPRPSSSAPSASGTSSG